MKSPDAQAKAAQERSTRARKAYRTRLENAAAKDNEPTAPWQEGETIQRRPPGRPRKRPSVGEAESAAAKKQVRGKVKRQSAGE